MKNVNMGRMLLDTTAVASKHGLVSLTELVMFFVGCRARGYGAHDPQRF